MENKIHKYADVQSSHIGEGTIIWQFSIVLQNAVIGKNCNINCHTFIENDVVIGNHVTIKSGVYLWDGIIIEDNVFVGPNVTFTNDKQPRSKQHLQPFQRIIVKKGASIGANSTILGGVEIGGYALIGAGSLVTKDVPDYALVYGSPATIRGWVNEFGEKLKNDGNDILTDANGVRYTIKNNFLEKLK